MHRLLDIVRTRISISGGRECHEIDSAESVDLELLARFQETIEEYDRRLSEMEGELSQYRAMPANSGDTTPVAETRELGEIVDDLMKQWMKKRGQQISVSGESSSAGEYATDYEEGYGEMQAQVEDLAIVMWELVQHLGSSVPEGETEDVEVRLSDVK